MIGFSTREIDMSFFPNFNATQGNTGEAGIGFIPEPREPRVRHSDAFYGTPSRKGKKLWSWHL